MGEGYRAKILACSEMQSVALELAVVSTVQLGLSDCSVSCEQVLPL